jgi:hypothetical protein
VTAFWAYRIAGIAAAFADYEKKYLKIYYPNDKQL